MSADDVKSAVERLTKIADAFANAYPQYSGGIYREVASLLSQLTEENEQLTKAMTGLTCGGSEFFVRRGGRFVADAEACVSWVRRTRQDAHKRTVAALRRATKAEAERDEIIAGLADFDADNMTSETHHPDHVLIPTVVFERVRALLARSAQGGENA